MVLSQKENDALQKLMEWLDKVGLVNETAMFDDDENPIDVEIPDAVLSVRPNEDGSYNIYYPLDDRYEDVPTFDELLQKIDSALINEDARRTQ